MKLIVGLGNPGEKYQQTRHNIGFWVIDQIAKNKQVRLDRICCDASVGETDDDGETLVLAKPQTFMNRSGWAVKELLSQYQGTPDDLIVVYDDLDLPFGRLRVRAKGSAGGHRGVVSIQEQLAASAFKRVRIGIGRPADGTDSADYVLSPFESGTAAQISEIVERASNAVECILRQGIERAMEFYNRAP